jgi:hypothetical protein
MEKDGDGDSAIPIWRKGVNGNNTLSSLLDSISYLPCSYKIGR